MSKLSSRVSIFNILYIRAYSISQIYISFPAEMYICRRCQCSCSMVLPKSIQKPRGSSSDENQLHRQKKTTQKLNMENTTSSNVEVATASTKMPPISNVPRIPVTTNTGYHESGIKMIIENSARSLSSVFLFIYFYQIYSFFL